MHQASEHATTAARHRLPARPTLARPTRLHSHPVQHRQGCTRSHVGERKRIVFTTLGSALTLTPNPSLLPRARSIRAAPPTHVMGRDNHVPPHYRYPAPKGASHTPTSPHQSVSTQASKPGQRGGGTTLSHHHTKAPTPRSANTHTNTPRAQTSNPTTRKQTRPQQACSSTTRANTRSAHTVACGRSQV